MRWLSLLALSTLAAACGSSSPSDLPDAPISPDTPDAATPTPDGSPDATPDANCTATTWYADCDGDGIPALGAETATSCAEPAPLPACPGWTLTDPTASNGDCDDTDGSVYPGASETCDGLDNDCDLQIDEDGADSFWPDGDGDGYGSATGQILACGAPSGYVANNADCNDASASVHPGAAETCNLVDDNCNAQTDEGVQSTFYRDFDGDGYGDPSMTTVGCPASPPAGYVANSADCSDTSAGVHPGAAETCNFVDDNCNAQTDEGVQVIFYRDFDGDAYGDATMTMLGCPVSPPAGYVTGSTDCNDTSASVHPGAAEVCNGADDNCNAQVDEGAQSTFYRDVDGDGYGNPGVTVLACAAPAGYVANNTDCDDAVNATHPGAAETCNSIDDNCNAQIDEGVLATYYLDADGDGYGNPSATTLACASMPPPGYVANNTDCADGAVAVHPGAAEVCFNSVDDNCSGAQDEAPECSIDCNWEGARWASHGWDGSLGFSTGAWVSCTGGKLQYMWWTTGVGTGVNPSPLGMGDAQVGCDWGSANRWASQGWDNFLAFSRGVDLHCDGARVTSFLWEDNLLQTGQSPVFLTGQLGCNWNGAVFLSHGWDGFTCQFATGFNVTCFNNHITNVQAVQSSTCGRYRD